MPSRRRSSRPEPVTLDTSWATATEIAAAVASGKTSAAGCRRGCARAHHGTQPGAQCLHRRHRRTRARARAGRSTHGKPANKALGRSPACRSRSRTCSTSPGLRRVAGSKINRDLIRRAERDSPLIERLEAAGAVLVGALNMGEYAYDFTGENVHDGPSRNPHDPTRMTGGSSGGSGGAVAGGLVPLALGSDTNGSIRVPSSFCGIFGLKPTYGRLSRARTFPFVASFDHLGPFARSTRDLALAYDAMQGTDPDDPVCADRPVEPALPALERGTRGPAHRGRRRLFPARRLSRGARRRSTALPRRSAPRARSKFPKRGARAPRPMSSPRPKARRCISTACATRADDFDPAVRDRLIAGAMVPAALVVQGAEIPPLVSRRACWSCSRPVDVILAPATPCTAPTIGQQTFMLDGVELPLRPNIGIYTQPISFIGLPVVAVPVPLTAAADRRADHRRALARGRGAARRARAGADGRGRCAPASCQGARMFLIAPAGDARSAILARKTLAEELRLQLADEIVRGVLAPGSALDEMKLARRFHVSRTPVREAIRQLAASGLIEARPIAARWWRGRANRLADMFESMAELEALCAGFAAERMTAPSGAARSCRTRNCAR